MEGRSEGLQPMQLRQEAEPARRLRSGTRAVSKCETDGPAGNGLQHGLDRTRSCITPETLFKKSLVGPCERLGAVAPMRHIVQLPITWPGNSKQKSRLFHGFNAMLDRSAKG